MIDISDLNKADVLRVLYNVARPQERGYKHYIDKPMTKEHAEAWLEKQKRFDYINGRVLKVDLSGDTFNPRLFDRDNGEGAAQKAINALRRGES